MGLIKGIALGAGAMYLLDPTRGNARCDRIRESFADALRSAKRDLSSSVRDLPTPAKLLACSALVVVGARRGWLGAMVSTAGIAGLAALVRGRGSSASSEPTIEQDRVATQDQGVTIDAPVERVFDYFMNPENLTRVMTKVREVKSVGRGLSHWTLESEDGPVTWEVALSRVVPNERIEWRSAHGSAVDGSGHVSFEPEAGRTRLRMKVSARFPNGVEHELAEDPRLVKSVVEEELLQANRE